MQIAGWMLVGPSYVLGRDVHANEGYGEAAGQFDSIYRCQKHLAQKSAQSFQIAPIAITLSGIPGNAPPGPQDTAMSQVAIAGSARSSRNSVALIA